MTVLLYVLGILAIAVGVALSIGLHEIGHLLPAKLFGVRVTQYMIGFGRTIFSRRKGETEYGLKLVPLGGYISMVGMFPPAKGGGRGRTASTGFFNTLVQDARDSSREQIQPGEEHRAFYRLAVWKRIVIMLGGPTMNLFLGILFTAIVLTGFGVYQPTTTVASISKCIVPASQTTSVCRPGDQAAPAANSGLKPGDRILAVNGRSASSWTDVTDVIRGSAGKAITLTVTGPDGRRDLTVTPASNTVAVTDANGAPVRNGAGTVETQRVGFIGISPTQQLTRQAPTAVLPAVWNNSVAVGGVIIHLPQRLVGVAQAAFGTGQRDPNGPISVVGVGRVAGEIASSSAVPLSSKVASIIGILASLNIALFVFNLIPLLPLDGGHVIGAVWEGIRRSIAKLFHRRDPGPVDTAKLMPLTFAVAILLGGMSVLLIYADIVRPITLF